MAELEKNFRINKEIEHDMNLKQNILEKNVLAKTTSNHSTFELFRRIFKEYTQGKSQVSAYEFGSFEEFTDKMSSEAEYLVRQLKTLSKV